MPYFQNTDGDSVILILGMVILVILILISLLVININCTNKKIKSFLIIGLILQIIILIIDNYIIDFPLINFDARSFENFGWLSYLYDVNIGRGSYNYYIINPIYKLLKIRVAIVFGAINVFMNIIININIYKILRLLKIKKNVIEFLMVISILSPISLIFRSGILREAIIIFFISYSLKNFIYYLLKNSNLMILRAFIYLGLAALFHGGVIFIAVGYFISLVSKGKNNKFSQLIVIVLTIVGFLLFKDKLIEKLGGGEVERIIAANNYTVLKNAGSGYLEKISTESLGEIILFLPLFIFYFLYSPTLEKIRGLLDIVTFLLNSSIYIFLTINGLKIYFKNKQYLTKLEKKALKSLMISFFCTVAVFSIGTRNAGTAMRHRDKVLPVLIIIYGILKNKEQKNVFGKSICKNANMGARDND